MNTGRDKAKDQVHSAVWKRLRLGFSLVLIGYFVFIVGMFIHSRDDSSEPDYAGAGISMLFGLFQFASFGMLALRALQIGRHAVYNPATMIRSKLHFMNRDDATGASLRGPRYWRMVGGLLLVAVVLCILLVSAMVKYALRTWE